MVVLLESSYHFVCCLT